MCALLLAAALSPVRGDSPRPGSSRTERVTIDGKPFLSRGTGHDDFSTVRREFEKFGIEVPGGVGVPAGPKGSNPAFSGGVVGSEGPPPGDPPALPPGLTADHALRLETGTGWVDLVLGRTTTRGSSIRTRLAADGWEGHERGEATGSPWLLEKRTGKETTIVCLDEAEGTFLLFRESGR
jgi:hypothetical protein